jgi:hypothetical protein
MYTRPSRDEQQTLSAWEGNAVVHRGTDECSAHPVRLDSREIAELFMGTQIGVERSSQPKDKTERRREQSVGPFKCLDTKNSSKIQDRSTPHPS